MPMSLIKEHNIKTLPAFTVKAEYAEEFGVLNCELSPRALPREWAIYVVKEADASVLMAGTLYHLSDGDALLVPPFESIYIVHTEKRFRIYRILIDADLFESSYPILTQKALFQRARFQATEERKGILFSLCEDLLSEKENSPLFTTLSLLEELKHTKNEYSENDEALEQYLVCLPLHLKKVMLYIRNNLGKPLNLQTISGEASVSTAQITKLFKAHLHLSVKDYVAWLKMLKASELLWCKKSVHEVVALLAYSSEARFSTDFRRFLGTTPSRYIHSGGIVYNHRLHI